MTVASSVENWARSSIYWLIAVASIIAFFIIQIFPLNVAKWILALLGIIFSILFFVFFSRGPSGLSRRGKFLANKLANNNVANAVGNAAAGIPAGAAVGAVVAHNIGNQISNSSNSDCPKYAKGNDDMENILDHIN